MLPSPLHQPNPHPTPPTKKSIFRGKQSNRSLIWMWRLSRAPLAGRRRRHFSQLTLLLPIQLQNKCVFSSPLLLYFCACFENQKQLWGKLLQFLIIFKSFFDHLASPSPPPSQRQGPTPSLLPLSKDALRKGSGGSVVVEIRPARVSSAAFSCKALFVTLLLNLGFGPRKDLHSISSSLLDLKGSRT